METNTVLYNANTLTDTADSAKDPLDEIVSSGFNILVLSSLHISPNGDILWNDEELVIQDKGAVVFDPKGLFGNLSKRLDSLLSKNTILHIFWGIGSGGFRDFSNIANLLKTEEGKERLKASFETLQKKLPQIKGFDFDNEDHHDIDTVVWLTEFLSISLNAMITYRPYFGQYFWEDCIEAIYKKLHIQPVLWWNLQCYEDGKVNDPKDWAQSIALRKEYNGVVEPQSYIIPGYLQEESDEMSPAMLQQVFANCRESVGGGFVVQNTSDLPTTSRSNSLTQLSSYSHAIKEGLLAVTEDVGSSDYD